ncbi:hypothetical protein PUNSTDRAFT_54215 [Punctularia strigosozonata HHB-11173 SS5]|uniref:uncharacterized protein n=1 Tax=Punctularia strigosozonata (strain HHB-11173) TaxID=741275 RepID=UPI000441768F|nr:uncharacterized protein PUNSTDRAFT_54215 [Punctularia strigosozonata HHB-11173 SS5]EIN06855.1 hypothetical protein PUNSTDRAFT_54215 [Punctularia strigosozonata HHB-11173 SS5]
MPHRAPDMRLLSALLSAESTYHKSLLASLLASSSAVTTFTAFASASAPPTSYVALAFADVVFSRADDAVRLYADSVQSWRERLEELREREEDLAAVVRDREILVTRLLKASKIKNPSHPSSNRSSLSGPSPANPRDSSSTLSLSLSSSSSNTKLLQAQVELQACEATLAEKQAALDALRLQVVRTGLQERCKALIECARIWGEAGKEGMKTLEGLGSTRSYPGVPNGDAITSPSQPLSASTSTSTITPTTLHHDGVNPSHAFSDTSSLTPSLSISQRTYASSSASASSVPNPRRSSTESYTLRIPPAHTITDDIPSAHALPELSLPSAAAARVAAPHPHRLERPLSHVSEAEHESASSDEDRAHVVVVENERFLPPGAKRKKLGANANANGSAVVAPTERRGPIPTIGSSSTIGSRSKGRERRASISGFFSGLFRTSPKKRRFGSPGVEEEEGDDGSVAGKGAGERGWNTRTDRYLHAQGRGRGKARGMSSDDEDRPPLSASATFPASGVVAGRTAGRTTMSDVGGPSARLKKGKGKGKGEGEGGKGWDSDGGVGSGMARAGSKKATGKKTALTPSSSNLSVQQPSPAKASPKPKAAQKAANGNHRRASSVDVARTPVSPPPALRGDLTRRASTTAAPRGSRSKAGDKEETLQSIVQSISSANRATWDTRATGVGADGAKAKAPPPELEVVKAPPPLSALDLDAEMRRMKEESKPRAKAKPEKSSDDADGWASPVKPRKDSRASASTPHTPPKQGDVNKDREPIHNPIPGLVPLKSALRTSRSPSPMAGSGSGGSIIASGSGSSVRRSLDAPISGWGTQRSAVSASPEGKAATALSREYTPVKSGDKIAAPGPLAITIPLPDPAEHRSVDKEADSADDDEEDTASLSSYATATGIEGLEVENEGLPPPSPASDVSESTASTPRMPSPPLLTDTYRPIPSPPAPEPPIKMEDSASGSGSNASTAGGSAEGPVRRKSVRMNLSPTFSRTPPPLDDDKAPYPWDETKTKERARKNSLERRPSLERRNSTEKKHTSAQAVENGPSGGGWSSRIRLHHHREDGEVRDMWEDSSEEDEAYGRAKRLLTRAARKAEGKSKAKA